MPLNQVSTCKVIKRKTLIGEVSVGKDLQLLGEDLQLVEVAVDGRVLSSSEFIVSSEALTLLSSAMPNEVRTIVRFVFIFSASLNLSAPYFTSLS